jgi:hypothetical protein
VGRELRIWLGSQPAVSRRKSEAGGSGCKAPAREGKLTYSRAALGDVLTAARKQQAPDLDGLLSKSRMRVI